MTAVYKPKQKTNENQRATQLCSAWRAERCDSV